MNGDNYPDTAQGLQDRPAETNPIYTMNTIGIKQLSYGYEVRVGCLEMAIESKEKLIKMLTLYIKDPKGMENRWNNEGDKIFNT